MPLALADTRKSFFDITNGRFGVQKRTSTKDLLNVRSRLESGHALVALEVIGP